MKNVLLIILIAFGLGLKAVAADRIVGDVICTYDDSGGIITTGKKQESAGVTSFTIERDASVVADAFYFDSFGFRVARGKADFIVSKNRKELEGVIEGSIKGRAPPIIIVATSYNKNQRLDALLENLRYRKARDGLTKV